jgi:hypothetical protein
MLKALCIIPAMFLYVVLLMLAGIRRPVGR